MTTDHAVTATVERTQVTAAARAHPVVTILDAMRDNALFARCFKESCDLALLDGLPVRTVRLAA